MREIEFRGKRLDNGEWVYGYYYNFLGEVSIIDVGFGLASEGSSMAFSLPDVIRVDPSTIGQFTGLKDKNGEEIYEGDVVKGTWSDHSESDRPDLWTYAVVKFGEGEVDASDYEDFSIYIVGFYLDYIKGCDSTPATILHYKQIEVIGNIYENPELLEKVKP